MYMMKVLDCICSVMFSDVETAEGESPYQHCFANVPSVSNTCASLTCRGPVLLVQGVRVKFDPQVMIVTWWVGCDSRETGPFKPLGSEEW